VGQTDDGRFVMVLANDRRDFTLLETFAAVEVESECGGDDKPYEVWKAGRAFTGIPTLH
jgi:hypothetical protein